MGKAIRRYRAKFLKRRFAAHLKSLEMSELLTQDVYKHKSEILDKNQRILGMTNGQEKMESLLGI